MIFKSERSSKSLFAFARPKPISVVPCVLCLHCGGPQRSRNDSIVASCFDVLVSGNCFVEEIK